MNELSNETHDGGGIAMIMMFRLSALRRGNQPHDTPVVVLKDGKEYAEYYYNISGDILIISPDASDLSGKAIFGSLTLADLVKHKITAVQSQTLGRPGKYDYELIEVSNFVKADKIRLRYLE